MTKKDIKADEKRTKVCKELYLRLFGKPFPKKWDIHWHINGMTSFHDKAIYMAADSIQDDHDLETLTHEFIHLYEPKLKHGKEFDRLAKKFAKEAKVVLPQIRAKLNETAKRQAI